MSWKSKSSERWYYRNRERLQLDERMRTAEFKKLSTERQLELINEVAMEYLHEGS